jgi:O-antigen/teichoic acid export membrane protein
MNLKLSSRHKNGLIGFITLAQGKIISGIIGIISLAIAYPYFGIENYGVWTTLNAIATFLIVLDLGLLNYIVNLSSKHKNKSENSQFKIEILNIVLVIIFITIISIVLIYILIFNLNIEKLIGLGADNEIDIKKLLFTFIAVNIINIPCTIIYYILIGAQKGHVVELSRSLGNILSLSILFLGIKYEANIEKIILYYTVMPTIVAFFMTTIKLIKNKDIKISKIHIKLNEIKKIIKESKYHLMLTIFNLINSSLDILIITKYAGIENAAMYGICRQLFTLQLFISYLSNPYWPIFGEAIAKKDYKWMSINYKRLLNITIIATVLTVIPIIIFADKILNWINIKIELSPILLIGYASLTLAMSAHVPMANLMQNQLYIKQLMVTTAIAAVFSVILKIFVTCEYGYEYIVWVGAFITLFFQIIPNNIYLNKIFNQKRNDSY